MTGTGTSRSAERRMAAARTALITGASRGIGLETARQLAARGFVVYLGARNAQAGQAAAQALAAGGADARFVPLDVTDLASVWKAVEQVVADTEHLDVLINNAGIFPDGERTILTVDRDTMLASFLTNTAGALSVAQALVPLLVKSPLGGRIVNVSSGAGALGDSPTFAPSYSVSKAALNAVTVQLAHHLKDKGISVNSVCPGWVKTDMGGLQAPRSVEEGASGIVWLAVDAPASLTGKFLRDRKSIAW